MFHKRKKLSKFAVAQKQGFRSGLEVIINQQLQENKIIGQYEQFEIAYNIPATKHIYTPDFILPNGIIIETKGRFIQQDRKKHILIKQQHPELDIRFVFQNMKQKISKNSKTTYEMWCIKNNFKYAESRIPDIWLNEPKKKLPITINKKKEKKK